MRNKTGGGETESLQTIYLHIVKWNCGTRQVFVCSFGNGLLPFPIIISRSVRADPKGRKETIKDLELPDDFVTPFFFWCIRFLAFCGGMMFSSWTMAQTLICRGRLEKTGIRYWFFIFELFSFVFCLYRTTPRESGMLIATLTKKTMNEQRKKKTRFSGSPGFFVCLIISFAWL